MRMPEKIADVMFAPCGMNCFVCYKHCNAKKACPGCLESDLGKPGHCRECKIKDCIKNKGLKYCYECPEFPCKQIKSLDKSYRTRYGTSLIQNSLKVKEKGVADFMSEQAVVYACPQCGGVISLHDAECSECHAPAENQI
jgi:hypothetical protein